MPYEGGLRSPAGFSLVRMCLKTPNIRSFEGSNGMNMFLEIWLAWLAVTTIPLIAFFVIGLRKIGAGLRVPNPLEDNLARPPIEILVPVKGWFEGQEVILRSLLEQDYSPCRVIFILENEGDPAASAVDKLCKEYPLARTIVSGIGEACAQKNHNLVQGVQNLRTDTEIIVFCDSTNVAPADWLRSFTAPLRAGETEVVTTFRAFDPQPENLAGVGQAMYAAWILVLAVVKPKPWGGATAIRRQCFESLNVAEAWSRTVVDDLVMGNILDAAGVTVRVESNQLLRTPLANQTIKGLVAYLDRQILFPKFTNPWIWGASLFFAVSFTLALAGNLAIAVLFAVGQLGTLAGCVAVAYLGLVAVLAIRLRSINPFSLSATRWLAALLPTICIASFVFLRSVFLNHIDWHGRRYIPGRGGVVVRSSLLPGS